ncbi:MAG: hypothetical protein AB1416_11975 [Actinomycetota bacterium]
MTAIHEAGGPVNVYEVTFTASSVAPLEEDAEVRITRAIAGLPGVAIGEGAAADGSRRLLTARFAIQVDQAMADAARDGSRLAKEALALAGLPDAQLVEMNVRLTGGGPGIP